MIISVASGKGGTGKTTVATNLALSLEDAQYVDCDVEEPNGYIFVHPKIDESKPVCLPVPKVDLDKCTYCGQCAEFCQFNALAVVGEKVLVFPELCHGCGGCSLVCPTSAITEENREIGVIEKGHKSDLKFIQGRLNIGEPMSTPVIRAVKREIEEEKVAVLDVSPGTDCPVIEAITGSDFSLLVTEPTPFGLYDLQLAVELLRKLKIPFGVIINRSCLDNSLVEDYCQKESIAILLKIPFDKNTAVLYSKGIPLVEADTQWTARFRQLFLTVKEKIK